MENTSSSWNSQYIDIDSTGQPIYEKIIIWAEENGAISNNNPEFSFGNGATGNIGIPIVDDWELYALVVNADVNNAGSNVTIDVMDWTTSDVLLTQNVPNNNGAVNNYVGIIKGLNIPVVEGTTLGFRTNTETGAISDVRAGAWLRREIGNFITAVELV
jgi:hypothetical protein